MRLFVEIIEWLMIIVAILSGLAFMYGWIDMQRAQGDGKMGGAMLMFFAALALGLDLIAFIIKVILEKIFG